MAGDKAPGRRRAGKGQVQGGWWRSLALGGTVLSLGLNLAAWPKTAFSMYTNAAILVGLLITGRMRQPHES